MADGHSLISTPNTTSRAHASVPEVSQPHVHRSQILFMGKIPRLHGEYDHVTFLVHFYKYGLLLLFSS